MEITSKKLEELQIKVLKLLRDEGCSVIEIISILPLTLGKTLCVFANGNNRIYDRMVEVITGTLNRYRVRNIEK